MNFIDGRPQVVFDARRKKVDQGGMNFTWEEEKEEPLSFNVALAPSLLLPQRTKTSQRSRNAQEVTTESTNQRELHLRDNMPCMMVTEDRFKPRISPLLKVNPHS